MANSILLVLDQLLQTKEIPNKGVPEVIELTLAQTQELLKTEPSPELTAYLYLGLRARKINPDLLLIVSLDNLRVRQDLIPLGLALRFGANPNGTWELNAGRYSIAISSALVLRDHRVVREIGITAWSLLLASGLNLKGPARPAEFGETRSVLQYFSENRLLTPDLEKLFQGFSTEKLPNEARNFIGILLNRKELVLQPNSEDQMLIVATYAESLYDRVSPKHLLDALKYYNNDYLLLALTQGAELRYASINELLIDMRRRVQLRQMSLAQVRLDQLLTAVKYGASLDKYQYAMLLSIMSEKAQLVSAAYREPRWKKECRNSATPSRELARLALGLQIEQGDKTQVCQLLSKYAGSNHEALIQAARERRANNLVSSGDLLTGSSSPRICENRGTLSRDPLELPKIATVSYLSSGKLYCIPSELYESVLKTGQSPFPNATGIHEPLPISIRTEIQNNLSTLKRYKFSPVNVPSFREMLNELDKPDLIEIDTVTLQDFVDFGRAQGLTAEQISNISPNQGLRALEVVGLATPLAELDSQEHRVLTLAQETVPLFQSQPETIPVFFQALRA